MKDDQSPPTATRPRQALACAGPPIPPERTLSAAVVIDGGYLRNVIALLKGGDSGEHPSPEVVEKVADLSVPEWCWRHRTYYCDAPPYLPRNSPSDAEVRRHRSAMESMDAISRLDRTAVRLGFCTTEKVWFDSPMHDDEGRQRRFIQRTIQKQVDVLLATELARIGSSGEASVIVLITGDGDLVPGVRAAQSHGTLVRLVSFDGNRGSWRIGTSQQLLEIADERRPLGDILHHLGMPAQEPTEPSAQ